MSILSAISVAELLLHLAVLPLILLNLYAIGSTSVIHINLKILLQCQSIGLLLVSLVQPVLILYPEGAAGLEIAGRVLNPLMFLRIVGVVLNGLVGYAMPIERCYATIRVRSYERDRGKCFSATVLTIMVLFLIQLCL